MIGILSCLCFRRSCLYVNSSQKCLERGFHINETIKVEKYVEFRSDTRFLFVENCSVQWYSNARESEDFFIEGYSNNVHLKLLNNEVQLYPKNFVVTNLSLEFVSYPIYIKARNSIINVPHATNGMNFDYDLFTLVNSRLSVSSGSICFEDYQMFRNIEVKCSYILITGTSSIPNNTNIILSGNSYIFIKDNFRIVLTTNFQTIDLLNQVVAIREYSRISHSELEINTRNSTVLFNGKFHKVFFILKEKETDYATPTSYSSVIFDSKNCPEISFRSSYNIIFNTNGMYAFPKMISDSIQNVLAPEDTVIEIKETAKLKMNISKGSFIRIRNILETADVQICGSLHLPFINFLLQSKIQATDIVFENSPIWDSSNILQITCSKASGNILVDVNSLTVGERKSIFNLDKDGSVSELKISPYNNLKLGEVFHWELVSESVEVWKEDHVLDWFACISDNVSKCQKNSVNFETVNDFTENFKINDYDSIYVESFCEELVSIDVKHQMNVSLAYGRFKISGDELIDTLRINESLIEKEDKSNITCKTLYIRNSDKSEITISPTVDLHIIIPCNLNPSKYSGISTVHIENGNTDIYIDERYLLAFNRFSYFKPDYNFYIVIENITGTIQNYDYPHKMAIINSNINFVIRENKINDSIEIINSNVNFISRENEMNELIFKDPTRIRNTNITTNFPLMIVKQDVLLDHTALSYKDVFVSFNGKVSLFDEKVDYKRSRFKDLIVGIENFDSSFLIVDRIFLESSPMEINISSIEFNPYKRPEILLNLTLSEPTLINIKSSSEYIPPRIRINKLTIDDNYVLGVQFPLVCINHGNLADFDIILPELENYTMKMNVYQDFKDELQCAMISFNEEHIVEEDVEDNVKNWFIQTLLYVFTTIIFMIGLTFIMFRRPKVPPKDLPTRNNERSRKKISTQ